MHLLLVSLGIGIGAVPDSPSSLDSRAAAEVRIGYDLDATTPYLGEPFVRAEREQPAMLGHDLINITLTEPSLVQLDSVLDSIDALYVAGGNTFRTNNACLRRHLGVGFAFEGTVQIPQQHASWRSHAVGECRERL